MSNQPRVVNKQFNSPIGLYSEQNVREVYERESQMLTGNTGTVGGGMGKVVNYNSPHMKTPANLQNSAVLRMLQEEENRQRYGQGANNQYETRQIRDQVNWPPTGYEDKSQNQFSFKDTVTPGVKRVAWPPPYEEEEGNSEENNQIQNTMMQKGQQGLNQPHQYAPASVSQYRPVQPPPPSTVTLLKEAPRNQPSPPIITSQPATFTLKGGKNLRGDLKWPPESIKKQSEEENRLRLELARGPVCRPLAVRKDYGPFFAKHALNSSYPGYKVPPGTQFYEQPRQRY